jgi:hypothetical protein
MNRARLAVHSAGMRTLRGVSRLTHRELAEARRASSLQGRARRSLCKKLAVPWVSSPVAEGTNLRRRGRTTIASALQWRFSGPLLLPYATRWGWCLAAPCSAQACRSSPRAQARCTRPRSRSARASRLRHGRASAELPRTSLASEQVPALLGSGSGATPGGHASAWLVIEPRASRAAHRPHETAHPPHACAASHTAM